MPVDVWQIIFTAVPSVLASFLSGVLLYEWKLRVSADQVAREKQEKKHEALVNGVVAMLRDRLIQVMDEHITDGFAPVHRAEVITKMYTAYHDLGGNDIVSATYTQFMKLPHHQGDDSDV